MMDNDQDRSAVDHRQVQLAIAAQFENPIYAFSHYLCSELQISRVLSTFVHQSHALATDLERRAVKLQAASRERKAFAAYFRRRELRRGNRLYNCCSTLVVKASVVEGQVKCWFATDPQLGYACGEHLLCSWCARTRAILAQFRWGERVKQLASQYSAYHVVLTLRNAPDLVEVLCKLESAWASCVNRRRQSRRRKLSNLDGFAALEGAVGSIEVKRGKGSKMWHPHIHLLCFVDHELGSHRGKWHLIETIKAWWASAVGQSIEETNIRVNPIGDSEKDLAGSCREVLKYAVKVSDMESFDDRLDVFYAAKGRRFLRAFGVCFNLQADDPPRLPQQTVACFRPGMEAEKAFKFWGVVPGAFHESEREANAQFWSDLEAKQRENV